MHHTIPLETDIIYKVACKFVVGHRFVACSTVRKGVKSPKPANMRAAALPRRGAGTLGNVIASRSIAQTILPPVYCKHAFSATSRSRRRVLSAASSEVRCSRCTTSEAPTHILFSNQELASRSVCIYPSSNRANKPSISLRGVHIWYPGSHALQMTAGPVMTLQSPSRMMIAARVCCHSSPTIC